MLISLLSMGAARTFTHHNEIWFCKADGFFSCSQINKDINAWFKTQRKKIAGTSAMNNVISSEIQTPQTNYFFFAQENLHTKTPLRPGPHSSLMYSMLLKVA